MSQYNVAVVGAAGAVGREILKRLEERKFPVKKVVLLATARSAGSTISFCGENIMVEEASPEKFEGIEIAFFCATTDASRNLAPVAVEKGAVVVDKSNAFRMDPKVPLVVPEVNPDALENHHGIVASPNCSTIQMVVPLKPIYDEFGIERIIVSTYQSVSGTGLPAIEELLEQTRDVLQGKPATRKAYPHQIAFNLIPYIDSFADNDYTLEEMKMVNETRKIFEDSSLKISATAVRVPVFYAHSEAITVQTKKPVSASAVRGLLKRARGVVVLDSPGDAQYPTPVECENSDDVFVGRIRDDLALDNAVSMWIVSNNLRKGASTNAVQIAERLIS